VSVSIDLQAAPPQRGVIIGDVAEVLGVPMPTLRSWEIRYGIPEVSRTSGRHRRYGPAALHALRLMRDEIARGQRAGLAAQSVHDMLAAQGGSAQAIAQILAQAQQLDGPALDRSFDAAAQVLGVGRSIDEVLLPAMRQVGAWSETACGSAPEKVLACGPGDEHTLGMQALALLLRLARWPCQILGPRIATTTLLAAATGKSAAGVVVVSQLASARRQAVASMHAVHRQHIALFYAGNAFAGIRARRGLPGVYLGTDLQVACALIDGALTGRGPAQ